MFKTNSCPIFTDELYSKPDYTTPHIVYTRLLYLGLPFKNPELNSILLRVCVYSNIYLYFLASSTSRTFLISYRGSLLHVDKFS